MKFFFYGMYEMANMCVAQYSAFEIEDEVLPNLREYSFANSLFWVGFFLILTRQFINIIANLKRLLPRVTLASSLRVKTPWTMHPRMRVK